MHQSADRDDGRRGAAGSEPGNAGSERATSCRRRLSPAAVGARCDKGLLLLDGDIPKLGPFVLPGNNYHVYDYALFWGAIRRDAERRLVAWQR